MYWTLYFQSAKLARFHYRWRHEIGQDEINVHILCTWYKFGFHAQVACPNFMFWVLISILLKQCIIFSFKEHRG